MTYYTNRRPFGADVSRTINEDTRYTVKAADFGFKDYDWGQTMSGVRIDTLAGGGRLLLGGVVVVPGQFITKADLDAGKLIFEPAANASGNGYANFTFSVRDSAGAYDSCPNCFSLNVCPTNDAPDARDDSATTKAGTAITIDVKANDSDPDNSKAELKVTQATLTDPSKGSLVINADGTVTFKPAAGVTGPVEFTYTLKDPGGLSDTAKVLVDVQPDGGVKQCLLFDFSGSSALDGPDGNVRGYTVSGVSVKVTAFARADDTGAWSKAYVGAYGGGLGVTDNSEGSGGNNSHTVDNLGCRDNYLVFSFDQQVVLDKAYLGYVVCDSDIKVWIGNIDGAYGQPPNLSDAVLASMGFTEVNQTTLSTARWADLNAGQFAGNVIIIAADTTDMSPEDQFKLQQLAVCTVPVVADNPPDGADVARTIAEDASYVVLASDLGFTDPDAGQTLAAVRIDSLPGNGRFTLNGVDVAVGQVVTVAALNAGQLRLIPDADESGSPYASFTFSVQDSSGRFDTAPNTFVLNVTPVNDGPIARPDEKTTPEDTLATGNVLDNDSDIDSTTLTVTSYTVNGQSQAAGASAFLPQGVLTINPDGSYTFQPAANYFGPVPVATYTVSDGQGGSATSTLTIEVTPVNDPPTDGDETNTVTEDVILVVADGALGDLLNNAVDIDNDPLTITGFSIAGLPGTQSVGTPVTIPDIGVITILANGSYSFQPAADYVGPVPDITYTVADGNGGTDDSTLRLTVVPQNDAPVDGDETNVVAEDGSLVVAATSPQGLLANATDADGDPLSITGYAIAGIAGAQVVGVPVLIAGIGTLTIQADGGYSFTPVPDYNGPVPLITYAVSDGNGGSDTSTLRLTVVPANDPPAGTPDINAGVEGTVLSGNVILNDSDPEGDSLSVVRFSLPGLGSFAAGAAAQIAGIGTLVIEANGDYRFTPVAGYVGAVPQATYVLSDGQAEASTTLSLSYTMGNRAPTVADVAVSLSEEGLPAGLPDAGGTPDTTDATTISGALVLDDANGDPITVTLLAPVQAITSGGVALAWSGSGSATLIGSAGGVEIIRASVAGGGYSVTVSGPIDHPVQGAEDALTLALGIRVSDGQASGTGVLNVTLEDDAPVATNVEQAVPDGTQRTNIMLVLDVSGSMTDDSGVFDPVLGRTLNRLELQQQAIDRLLDSYDAQGDVQVRIVTFSTNAEPVGGVWTDVATARTQLAGIVAGGFTNYDEALTDAMDAFASDGKLELAQNVTYFLSDGNPNTPDGVVFNTADDGIQADEEAAWRAFLEANGMNSFALGLGGAGVTQVNLDPVAYDGATIANTDGFVVTNLVQLADVLADTVEQSSTGRLGLPTDAVAANAFGADGGHVRSISLDGTVYSYDPANGGSISVTGTDASRFDTTTNSLRIVAASGGVFQVDLDDGTYRYAAPTQAIVGGDQIGFVLVDRDGDTASGTLTLQASGGPNQQRASEAANEVTADVFHWTLADAGSAGQPTQLQATGFDAAHGTLDLHDLLVGESTAGGIGNLENFLSFQTGADGTQVLVSSQGGFAGGDYQAGAHDATLVLGTDLVAGLGLAAGAGDALILGELLRTGKLVVDQG